MTKKHFTEVANMLAGELATATSYPERLVIRNITLSLADIYKRENPNFDRERFYAAVGF